MLSRNWLTVVGLAFIASASLSAGAEAKDCDGYDTVLHFQFTAKNFEGDYTTGCVGFDQASLTAGNGPMHYEDSYCGGRSMTTSFRVVGSRLRLSEFVYPGCNGKGKDNVADITLSGFKTAPTCFTDLEFYWKYYNGGGDTSKAKATGDSLC